MEKSCIWNFNYFEKEKRLPKSYEELCDLYPTTYGEYYINAYSEILQDKTRDSRDHLDKNLLPDRATAEAVLALCQLIQLRNCYNGDWVPDWNSESHRFVIEFYNGSPKVWLTQNTPSILYFKTREIGDEFLNCFRPIIEKLKPLYGIKEGGTAHVVMRFKKLKGSVRTESGKRMIYPGQKFFPINNNLQFTFLGFSDPLFTIDD